MLEWRDLDHEASFSRDGVESVVTSSAQMQW